MQFELSLLAISSGLFVALLVLVEVGRRIGLRNLARDPDGALAGTGAVEGALFALFGLLIAFTFSGAAQRFDDRRRLITEEANEIGTAYLRIDLLPEATRPALRESFRRYADSRLAIYRALPDMQASEAAAQESARIQRVLWAQAVAASEHSTTQFGPSLALDAINSMLDISTTRTMATKIHPPIAIYIMLFVLALGSALLVGYSMAAGKKRNWVHSIAFALFTAISVHLILDMEYPRRGFIRVDDFDQAIEDERRKMDLPVP